MNAKIIDGKQVADSLKTTLRQQADALALKNKHAPGLAVILVGHDPASEIYVRRKRQVCVDVGIKSFAYDLPADITQNELVHLVETLNRDPSINGILIQMPLPTHIDAYAVVNAILPSKDVDGFHPYNLGRLVQRRPLLRPCTPLGIMTLLDYYALQVKGLHAVVIGASNIVGRPMGLELLLAGATVTTCHRFTENLQQYLAMADIVVVAVGKRHVIQSEWIKAGAVVIDVGIHRLEDGKICGDVDFATASQRASWITPVPGGVGPMTVITLMQNTLQAAENQNPSQLL